MNRRPPLSFRPSSPRNQSSRNQYPAYSSSPKKRRADSFDEDHSQQDPQTAQQMMDEVKSDFPSTFAHATIGKRSVTREN